MLAKKIDIHSHVTMWPDTTPPLKQTGQTYLRMEDQLRLWDEINVQHGVLLPVISSEAQWMTISSEACHWLASQDPKRFSWFCNVDPRAGTNTPDADLSHIIEFYKNLGAKGVGELTSNLYADDPKMDNLFYHCAACEMPVLFHVAPKPEGYYGIVDDPGLPRLERVLQKHPKLKILGHSQPFWSEIGTNVDSGNRNDYPSGKIEEGRLIELLRKYDNLYCDCSAGSGANALMRDPDYTEQFFEEFSDRLLYGCDICQSFNRFPYELDAFLDQMLRDKRIREENYYKFVRGNAIKLLKLEDAE